VSSALDRTLPEVAAALRAREVSATELVTDAIERHDRLDGRLHAYKLWTPDAALEEARKADDALAGGDARPLTGIPVSVKDLYGLEGTPTFAGTPRRLPDSWSRDSWLVGRLRGAGAISVGKTHMVEMAFGGVGINPHWGTPWNPWDANEHRIPGGSSSGAGVSLAEGSALIALGSDTGGSIRIPAALTGTVGQRQTRGRWPTTGVVPLSHTFDTVGALTRSVEDSIYFFGAVDPDWGDPDALLAVLSSIGLGDLRIGVPVCAISHDCQPDVGDVVSNALADLGAAGATLVEVDGRLFDTAYDLALGGGTIAATECREFLERELPGWIDILHPIVGRRLANGLSSDDPAYARDVAEHHRLAAEAPSLFEGVDVVALPANLVTPARVADLDIDDDVDRYVEVNRTILRPTYPVGVLGLTAISIPVGLDASGMPVGLQLIGPAGADEAVLAAAWAVQETIGSARELLGTPPAVVL